MGYKHLHIVGCSPRSGTTLMSELCRTSFEIDGFYKNEKSIFKCRPWEHHILLSKAPTETIYLPWLLHINPNLWCIYMLRDPRDVITSFHRGHQRTYLSNLRIWKAYDQHACRTWNHNRFIVVKYEDLVTNPDGVQAMLASRVPFLKITRKFSEFGPETNVSERAQYNLNEVRPVDNKSIGRWRERPGRVKYQLQLHGDISRRLIEQEYESNDKWLSVLNDVEPDTSHIGEPDFLSWHKRLRVKYRILRKLFYYTLLVMRHKQ